MEGQNNTKGATMLNHKSITDLSSVALSNWSVNFYTGSCRCPARCGLFS